jgi:hypothetical protein
VVVGRKDSGLDLGTVLWGFLGPCGGPPKCGYGLRVGLGVGLGVGLRVGLGVGWGVGVGIGSDVGWGVGPDDEILVLG